jgi:CMP-N-acetylneuraminic acid synthetase
MKTKRIVAVIPIRSGSQRVINKNLRNFAGINLLKLKIEMLKSSNLFDEIIVNTDSEEAIQIAKDNKISFHRREEYYASAKCTGSEFFEHLGKVTDTDIFAYCPVTSPFISKFTMEKCVVEYYNYPEADCVATVSLIKEFLWLNNEPLNYEREKAPNSQNLPDIVALNFGFTVIDRKNLIQNKNIIGKKPHFVITEGIEAIDIDTPLDFCIAESLYLKTIINKKEFLDVQESFNNV